MVLGLLIEECSKGAYSVSGRSTPAKGCRNQAITTTDTTIINNDAIPEEQANPVDKPKKINRKWTYKEVKRLHRCVEIFGTDFSIITKLFPNRKRSELMVRDA
jgi:hypothetical protein